MLFGNTLAELGVWETKVTPIPVDVRYCIWEFSSYSPWISSTNTVSVAAIPITESLGVSFPTLAKFVGSIISLWPVWYPDPPLKTLTTPTTPFSTTMLHVAPVPVAEVSDTFS